MGGGGLKPGPARSQELSGSSLIRMGCDRVLRGERSRDEREDVGSKANAKLPCALVAILIAWKA